MQYTIPSTIVNISDITIEAHIDRLGRNQIKAFERYVRTGVIRTEHGAPAILARAVRRFLGLPILHITRRNVSWEHMYAATGDEQEQFFTTVHAAMCAFELSIADQPNKYDEERYSSMREAIAGRHNRHSFWPGWGSDASAFTLLLKGMKLGEYTGPVPTSVFFKADLRTAARLGYEQE